MNEHTKYGMTCKVIHKKNRSYLLVPNHYSGLRNRYTVYLIPSEQRSHQHAESFDIVGRELSITFIKRYLTKLDKCNGDVVHYAINNNIFPPLSELK